MLSKRLGLVLVLAAIVAIALAAPTFGGSAKAPNITAKRAGLWAAHPTLRAAHRVEGSSAASASLVRGAHLRFYATNAFPIPAGGRDDSYLLCPRRFTAINGFFATDGGIVADTSSAGSSARRWDFGLIDLTGLPGQAFIGIVCLNGIGS